MTAYPPVPVTGPFFIQRIVVGPNTLLQQQECILSEMIGLLTQSGNAVLEGVNQRLGLQLTLLFSHVPG